MKQNFPHHRDSGFPKFNVVFYYLYFLSSIVSEMIKDSINKFYNAVGLVVALSNEFGCQNAQELPGINAASKTIGKSFSKLGYAHCVFQNCCKAKFLAIFQVLSKKDYPKSYRNLFIYFTGHGYTNHISTRDGYIAINSLKKLLCVQKCKDMAKIVFLIVVG